MKSGFKKIYYTIKNNESIQFLTAFDAIEMLGFFGEETIYKKTEWENNEITLKIIHVLND
tara:strand:- start:138 stop:317 length:180 start_codon:yes stop_codon:yes gene_type:complete